MSGDARRDGASRRRAARAMPVVAARLLSEHERSVAAFVRRTSPPGDYFESVSESALQNALKPECG